MQFVRLLTRDKNIRAQINTQLNLWNTRAFDEILNDYYATATVYVGRAHGTQNAEQRHRTFSKNNYVKNCVRPSGLFANGKHGEYLNQVTGDQ